MAECDRAFIVSFDVPEGGKQLGLNQPDQITRLALEEPSADVTQRLES
jgi:hypothetical protein